jgi:hypothetical protein
MCKGSIANLNSMGERGSPLPHSPIVKIFSPSLTIKKEGGRGGGPKGGDPIPPSLTKTQMLHDVQKVRPIYSVKGLGDINLDKDGRDFSLVQVSYHLFDIHEAIMNVSFSDESSLVD